MTNRKNPTAKADKVNVYDIVTEQMLDLLSQGVVPWRMGWDPNVGLPRSLSTGKAYRGLNIFTLGVTAQMNGWTSPWWGTYKQIAERGGQVRKGEKSTLITFWKVTLKDETDETTGQTVTRKSFILRYFRVFNADQADGIKVPEVKAALDFTPIEACEAIVSHYFSGKSPALIHGQSIAAYAPSIDTVMMPNRETFDTVEGYYSVLFHEATHSTGHASRLNRDGVTEGHRFGDEMYAKEELVAEMGAAFLCGIAGVEQVTLPNSAAYIDHWTKVLRGDPKMVLSAAAQAQKAADLVAGVAYSATAQAAEEAA